jgi:TRAP-type C4-dicarboxylate transport system permease small subunit
MNVLVKLAKLFAITAGVLLTVITLITCGSLIGRNTTGVTLMGDYELTAVTAGAAVALFLPWCQVKRGNIIVDFFTANASAAATGFMDRIGSLVLAVVMGVIAWRTVFGAINAYESQTTTMMLGFPEWIAYASIAPGLALTGVIALTQAVWGDFKEQAQ